MAKAQRKLGMLLSYGSNLLLVAVNIFLTPFLVSKLGNAEYGVYQMMASFAGYLVLINFGTGTVMTRYVSVYLGKKDKRGEKNFIAMCLMITAVLVLLIVGVAVVLYLFMENIYGNSLSTAELAKAKQLFVILAVNIVLTLLGQVYAGIITAYEKFTVTNGYNLVKIVLKAVLIVVLFSFRADSLVVVLVDLLLTAVYLGVCFCYSQFVLKATPKLFKFDKKLFASAAVFSLAIMLQAIVNQVNTKVDVTILGIMVGPESVTTYSVAMQVFSIFSSVSTAAFAIYLPKFSRLVAKGESDGDTLTREMIPPSRVQTLISGVILFGFILCGRDFISVWMGEGYTLSYYIAVIIMIPMFLVYSNGIVVSVLDAMQKRLVRSVVLTLVALANVGITILLVFLIGEIGAPVATAVTTFIGSFLIMNIYYKKVIGIKLLTLFSGIFRGIIPSLLLAFFVALPIAFFVPIGFFGLILKGGVFVLVLFISLLLFGLTKDEKELLLKPFTKKTKKEN